MIVNLNLLSFRLATANYFTPGRDGVYPRKGAVDLEHQRLSGCCGGCEDHVGTSWNG